jgi:hypothetical protein
MGVFAIPGEFTPSIRGRNKKPKEWRKVRFLSPYICKLIAQQINKKQLEMLKNKNFDYLIAEAILRLGVMKPTDELVDSKWLCSNWSYFSNPGGNKELGQKMKIATPNIPLCTKEIHYSGMHLNVSASELEESTYYTSNAHNAALYDGLLVSHTDRIVYMFQSSNVDANKHAFSFDTIKKVMDGLGFDKEENRGYKLCYIYCSDSSKHTETGFDIQKTEKISDEEFNKVTSRLVTMIARVRYYLNVPEVLLKKINQNGLVITNI